jgi:hypothetical protein
MLGNGIQFFSCTKDQVGMGGISKKIILLLDIIFIVLGILGFIQIKQKSDLPLLFGTGEATSFSQREYYIKTPFEFSMNLSRGFTKNIVLQAGIKYRSVNTSNFEPGSKFYSLPDPRSRGTVQ